MTEDWKPIESAPKDGTHILAYGWSIDVFSNAEGRNSVREIWRKWNYIYRYVEAGNGLYRQEDSRSNDHWAPDTSFTPTHWMPLPKAPDA